MNKSEQIMNTIQRNHPRHDAASRLLPLLPLLLLVLASCAGEAPLSPSGRSAMALRYVLPSNTGTVTRGLVEALPQESAVSELQLFFFLPDKHQNGTFVASTPGTLVGSSLTDNTVEVTLPEGVSENATYHVLVVANLNHYLKAGEIPTFRVGKTTEGEARRWFTVELPLNSQQEYELPSGGYLPMSGSTVKEPGGTMSVDLLRAAVRVDVMVSAEAATAITLETAQLRNIPSLNPLFELPLDAALVSISTPLVAAESNAFRGKFFGVETYRNVKDPLSLAYKATCVIVRAKNDTYSGWYRVDLNVNEGLQYLQRNNAYTVLIKNISADGADTAEAAYATGSTSIESVTVAAWKDSGLTPPETEIQ